VVDVWYGDRILTAEIQQAVSAMYANVVFESVEEITDENGNIVYQVDIETDEQEAELTLDATGSILITVEEIALSQVPAAVLANINSELAGYDEVELEKASMSNGVVQYMVELENELEM